MRVCFRGCVLQAAVLMQRGCSMVIALPPCSKAFLGHCCHHSAKLEDGGDHHGAGALAEKDVVAHRLDLAVS